jgi:hypothetical protein
MEKRILKSVMVLPILFFGVNNLYCQTSETVCSQGSYEVIQPFLGEWEEYTITDSIDVYIGKLSTHINLDGCVLTQSFDAPDLNFSYQSQGFVNPNSNIWEETYVFNSGGYSRFLWILDGESLYTLRVGGSQKADNLHRLRYTDIKKDEYVVIAQESRDGGKTWISKDSTRIKRIK